MNGTSKRLGRGFCWQELTVGAFGRTVTSADINAFVGLAGMIEILFTNAEYRRNNSAIKGEPSPGALVFLIAEALSLNATSQEAGLAFRGLSSLDIKGPVQAGDTLEVEIEILDIRQESKGSRGLVRTQNIVRNQHGREVMIYKPLRLMMGRPE
ncbi:MaoC family dehydratase N-terminal domain-containing protein [Marinobacter sp.]|uniref:MaoC family dehydratase n=1 Tax=Marinobacter sp. TaxID=50741 RepID=UPI001B6E6D3B|nr:MaoC family dehydratase N-terminal domain-containing protein [Marinobacter sp.]MBQ0832287.1 MaoC family dehydratase N-terminal domain-containing protein [Marinobacter sp.]